MAFSKNHKCLYFDTLVRDKKQESVLSLIHATFQAKKNDEGKEKIAENLEYAYKLFKFDSGSYEGNMRQFESQYTIGHEMGIWKNSDLTLNELAEKVALNQITITEYFDIVFLNYIQPIDGKVYNVLYLILSYMKKNRLTKINKDELKEVFSFASEDGNNNINGLFNFLIGTNYFDKKDRQCIELKCGLDDILSSCCLKYHEKEYEEVKNELKDLETYVNYLTIDNRNNKLYPANILSVENKGNSTNDSLDDLVGYNKIFYGIPGCGKSYYVENHLLKDVEKVKNENVFRTTFYLDYSNSDFIGQILPKVEENGQVTYVAYPGPFTKALEKALKTPDEKVFLIIEEINRGNAAAIFGDLFQLLDRERETDLYAGKIKGQSQYPISNEFIETYFNIQNQHVSSASGEKKIPFTPGKIIIPNNLYIVGTMNTSDQGVFPLDTAFKRRWNRVRVVNDWENDDSLLMFKDLYIPLTNHSWFDFVTTINDFMMTNNKNGVLMEDKKIGAYFINKDLLVSKENKDIVNQDNKNKLAEFVFNVIDYIYNDVSKFDRHSWFKEDVSFDELASAVLKYENDKYIGDDNFLLNVVFPSDENQIDE